ncbi:PstS family phosphate ABC transporter substrate-binding protein [Fredinandcohnia sp. 179-A 10B2 NHS]|uniref:PstS family phosphate ABC transporter substrate-binding protein n=1 Tax=Fredinandcohnia sp. 179-A 10B2 NHS TaxID=3235176 RepID=UPI0039A29506
MNKFLSLFLLRYILIPFALSFTGFITLSVSPEYGNFLGLLLFAAGGTYAGYTYGKKQVETETFWRRYLPVYLPLAITVLVASSLTLHSKGNFGDDSWSVFVFLFFPFFPNSLISGLIGQFLYVFLAPFTYFLLVTIGFVVAERKSDTKVKLVALPIFLSSSVILIGLVISGYVLWERSQTVLPSYGFTYENGYSSVDLEPYYVTNPTNSLPKLSEPATFTISNPREMPILDGAEAAYPVYAAFANETFENISVNNTIDDKFEIVSFTNTIYAFERLLSGDVDIFFGAQPSERQMDMAKRAGKELILTPIGKEAFVFFVNSKNTITNLSTDQIKDIYSGKVSNWEEVNGNNDKIRAFQRPADSGSQTIMEKVMGDTPLMEPLKEEISGMGDIMEEVADYRNYSNAIGYSFRFFTTGMNPSDEIKLLSINGIEPSPENIRNGTYPYTVNLYAVSVKGNSKETISPFLEWMQGPQGQEIVEEIGYISSK